MKQFRIWALGICMLGLAQIAASQNVTETFAVSGNCGMCEKKIEKAATEAGATVAEWDVDKKELKVTFNSSETSLAKIQKKIAKAGYDNAGAKATQESYDKLHGCCKYERSSTNEAKMDCCREEGKCEAGKDCCKDGKCTGKGDCCKDGKCAHEKSSAAHHADGKCSKEGSCCQ
jgi:hypothetical protein